MQLFFYDRSFQSLLAPFNGAIATRLGFMIADGAVGTTSTHFKMRALRDITSFPVKEQLVLDGLKRDDEERWAETKEHAALIKKVRALKRKDKEAIVIIKKYERIIDELYELEAQEMEDRLGRFGYTQIYELVVPGGPITYYPVNDHNPEDASQNHIAASNILQLLPNEDDKDEDVTDLVFLLPFEAMSCTLMPRICLLDDMLAAGGAAIQDPDVFWVCPLLQLSNINAMSPIELQVLRSQLRAPGEALRSVMDRWAARAVAGQLEAAEGIRYMQEEVAPAAARLQTAINSNKTLSSMRIKMGGLTPQHVYIGELSLREYWTFLEKVGHIAPETLEKLRAVWDTRGTCRVPVMVLADESSLDLLMGRDPSAQDAAPVAAASDSAAPAAPVSVRKSISFD